MRAIRLATGLGCIFLFGPLVGAAEDERALATHASKRMEALSENYYVEYVLDATHNLAALGTDLPSQPPERQVIRRNLARQGGLIEVTSVEEIWYPGEAHPVTVRSGCKLTGENYVFYQEDRAELLPVDGDEKTREFIEKNASKFLSHKLWEYAYGNGEAYFHEIFDRTPARISWRWEQAGEPGAPLITAARSIPGDRKCADDLTFTIQPDRGFSCAASRFQSPACDPIVSCSIATFLHAKTNIWLPREIVVSTPAYDSKLAIEPNSLIFQPSEVAKKLSDGYEAFLGKIPFVKRLRKTYPSGAQETYSRTDEGNWAKSANLNPTEEVK